MTMKRVGAFGYALCATLAIAAIGAATIIQACGGSRGNEQASTSSEVDRSARISAEEEAVLKQILQTGGVDPTPFFRHPTSGVTVLVTGTPTVTDLGTMTADDGSPVSVVQVQGTATSEVTAWTPASPRPTSMKPGYLATVRQAEGSCPSGDTSQVALPGVRVHDFKTGLYGEATVTVAGNAITAEIQWDGGSDETKVLQMPLTPDEPLLTSIAKTAAKPVADVTADQQAEAEQSGKDTIANTVMNDNLQDSAAVSSGATTQAIAIVNVQHSAHYDTAAGEARDPTAYQQGTYQSLRVNMQFNDDNTDMELIYVWTGDNLDDCGMQDPCSSGVMPSAACL